jgi:hypothetical protein
MTPSINRLAESADRLGEYVMAEQLDVIEEQFVGAGPMDFEQFTRWVTGYVYYDALVCVCAGTNDKIMKQLSKDYDALTALAGYDIVVV